MTPFRIERLGNGIEVEFFDRSSRYFGDYHRVRVEVRLHVPQRGQGARLISGQVLERMGVAGGGVESVRNRLVDDYWQHAGGYLARAEYPARLLAAEAAPRRRGHSAGCRCDVP